MTRATTSTPRRCLSPAAAPALEDLVPIAVVIAAGCEPCAVRTVRRALQRGSAKASIARTLEVVAQLRALGCFIEAVGAGVIARMEGPLQAASKTLEAAHVIEEPACSERSPGTHRAMG